MATDRLTLRRTTLEFLVTDKLSRQRYVGPSPTSFALKRITSVRLMLVTVSGYADELVSAPPTRSP